MIKRIGTILVLILLITSSLFIVFPVESLKVSGNILYVGGSGPGNYTKIQDAINDSFDGQTVFVYSGIYNESLVVNKRINLIGEKRSNTIITYDTHYATVIRIRADKVNISGFTICVKPKERDFSYDWDIVIDSNYNTISGNILTSNSSHAGYGIYNLRDNNIISENIITNLRNGIRIERGNYNTINNNLFSNNEASLYIFDDSKYNLIKLNNFSYTAGSIDVSRGSNDMPPPHPSHTLFFKNNFYNYYYNRGFLDILVAGYTNKFLNNYYIDWIGLKCQLFFFIPYKISFIFCIYDWQPSLKPYEIIQNVP